eukprot:scaffold174678_cov27-Prasinocladus_malaysianus.AAC.3
MGLQGRPALTRSAPLPNSRARRLPGPKSSRQGVVPLSGCIWTFSPSAHRTLILQLLSSSLAASRGYMPAASTP